VAERAGVPADDFPARVLAGAVIGSLLATLPRGVDEPALDHDEFSSMERALDLLRAGLPLGRR
jgi:hypothetical protein